jgi:exosortase/archaeosortase family protein
LLAISIKGLGAAPAALAAWALAFAALKSSPAGPALTEAFCLPAAWLCGLYLGTWPEALPEGGASLSQGASSLLVGPSCAATSFFLLLSLGLLYVAMKSPRRGVALVCGALGAAYLLTLAANACRLLCVWECLKLFGPEPFGMPGGAFHYLLGAAVFWPLLVAAPLLCHYLMNKRGENHVLPGN